MPTYDTDGYSIEVMEHYRVVQQGKEPVRDMLGRVRDLGDGGLLEQFAVRVLRDGEPFAWGRDFVGEPEREIYEFVGREVLDVYAAFATETGEVQLTPVEIEERIRQGLPMFARKIGIKQGADFRTRFWPNLVHRLRKVKAARELGKPIGEVRDDEIPDKDAPVVEPVDLRAKQRGADVEGKPVIVVERSIDEAVELLTGKAVRNDRL